MKFVSVRDLRGRSSEVWKRLLKDKQMVITSNGRPIAILSGTSEETLEESLSAIRTAQAVAAVEVMQTRSVATGKDKTTASEIEAEIRAARRLRS